MKLCVEIVWNEPKHFFFPLLIIIIALAIIMMVPVKKLQHFLPNYSIMRNKHYHIVLILRTARKQKKGKGL